MYDSYVSQEEKQSFKHFFKPKKNKDKQRIITYPKKSDETKYMKSFVQRTGEMKKTREKKKITDWKIIDPVTSAIRTPMFLCEQQ